MIDTPPADWKLNARPRTLFSRFDFESYAQTRLFLDLLAQESERTGRYPDLSFGPRHVNVTLALEASGEDDEAASNFALNANRFAEQARQEGLQRAGVEA